MSNIIGNFVPMKIMGELKEPLHFLKLRSAYTSKNTEILLDIVNNMLLKKVLF